MHPLPPRDEIARRIPRLLLGLVLFGVGLAFLVTAHLGLSPWFVLHEGIAMRTGIPIGMVTVLTGLVVLVAWVPLGERFGVGTLLNVLVIGTVVDVTLAILPEGFDALAVRIAAMIGGVVLVGVGSGFYIGAGLGPGPRDGLMTGLARRGFGLGRVRMELEVTVLVTGWLLGGTVGAGTVVFALGMGPLVAVFVPLLTVEEPAAADR